MTPKNKLALKKKVRKAATTSKKKTLKMISEASKDDLTDIDRDSDSAVDMSWETLEKEESKGKEKVRNDMIYKNDDKSHPSKSRSRSSSKNRSPGSRKSEMHRAQSP